MMSMSNDIYKNTVSKCYSNRFIIQLILHKTVIRKGFRNVKEKVSIALARMQQVAVLKFVSVDLCNYKCTFTGKQNKILTVGFRDIKMQGRPQSSQLKYQESTSNYQR